MRTSKQKSPPLGLAVTFIGGITLGFGMAFMLGTNVETGGDRPTPDMRDRVDRPAIPASAVPHNEDVSGYHVTRKKICDNSIVDKEKALAAIDIRDTWMADAPSLAATHRFHDEGLDHKNFGQTYEKWEFFGPVTPVCPVELTRFGGRSTDDDEVKVFCVSDDLKHAQSSKDECTVFSIGGRNEWTFEEDIHKRTACKIHTFDCTIDGQVPPKIQDRTTFYKLCVDGEDNIKNGMQYKTLETLIAVSGGKRPTLLKFDVEGYEFPLFRRWIMDADADPERYLPVLPDQMSFEMHYQYQNGKGRSPAELTVLSQALYRLGYVLVYKRRNPFVVDAIELVMQRIVC